MAVLLDPPWGKLGREVTEMHEEDEYDDVRGDERREGLRRRNDRRSMNTRDFAVLATLLINFGALVWGAATMSSTVKTLEATAHEIRQDISSMNKNHNDRIGLLEIEAANIKARLFFLEEDRRNRGR